MQVEELAFRTITFADVGFNEPAHIDRQLVPAAIDEPGTGFSAAPWFTASTIRDLVIDDLRALGRNDVPPDDPVALLRFIEGKFPASQVHGVDDWWPKRWASDIVVAANPLAPWVVPTVVVGGGVLAATQLTFKAGLYSWLPVVIGGGLIAMYLASKTDVTYAPRVGGHGTNMERLRELTGRPRLFAEMVPVIITQLKLVGSQVVAYMIPDELPPIIAGGFRVPSVLRKTQAARYPVLQPSIGLHGAPLLAQLLKKVTHNVYINQYNPSTGQIDMFRLPGSEIAGQLAQAAPGTKVISEISNKSEYGKELFVITTPDENVAQRLGKRIRFAGTLLQRGFADAVNTVDAYIQFVTYNLFGGKKPLPPGDMPDGAPQQMPDEPAPGAMYAVEIPDGLGLSESTA